MVVAAADKAPFLSRFSLVLGTESWCDVNELMCMGMSDKCRLAEYGCGLVDVLHDIG